GERSPRAADIGRAFHETDAPVGVDAGGGARFQAAIEPEPGGDAATAFARDGDRTIGSAGLFLLRFSIFNLRRLQWRGVMRMLLCRLDRLDHADPGEHGAISPPSAFVGTILDPELERVDLELLAQLIDDRFRSEGGVGGARGSISGRGRLVDAD